MTLLDPSQIAEQMGTDEYISLCVKVEKRYGQEFGIVSIRNLHGNRIVCEIELRDNTRHIIHLDR